MAQTFNEWAITFFKAALAGTLPSAGGGGPATIANGADVAEGSIADTAYVSGSGTVISILKGLFGKFSAGTNGLNTVSRGTDTIATGQVTFANGSPTLLVAARAGRASVSLTTTAGVAWYVGGPTVSSTTAPIVSGTQGSNIVISTSAAIYGISSNTSTTIAYLETY